MDPGDRGGLPRPCPRPGPMPIRVPRPAPPGAHLRSRTPPPRAPDAPPTATHFFCTPRALLPLRCLCVIPENKTPELAQLLLPKKTKAITRRAESSVDRFILRERHERAALRQRRERRSRERRAPTATGRCICACASGARAPPPSWAVSAARSPSSSCTWPIALWYVSNLPCIKSFHRLLHAPALGLERDRHRLQNARVLVAERLDRAPLRSSSAARAASWRATSRAIAESPPASRAAAA